MNLKCQPGSFQTEVSQRDLDLMLFIQAEHPAGMLTKCIQTQVGQGDDSWSAVYNMILHVHTNPTSGN